MKQAQLTIVSKPITELIPHPSNPNIHSEGQIKKLAHSIKKHGFSKGSVVIQKSSGRILAGHGIIEALKLLGYTDVDVVEADLADGQAEAFMISDNFVANQAIIDDIALQKLINELGDMPARDYGFDKDDLEDLAGRILAGSGGYQADEKDDDVPEVKESITQKGDLWTLGKLQHRVLCGDSTCKDDVDNLMEGNEAELLFTSPPYSDMRDYEGNIDLSISHLVEFISRFSSYAKFQVINLGIKRVDNEIDQYWNEYISKAKTEGYKLLSWNVWNREKAGFSISQITAMFAIQHEWIFVFGKDTKKLNLTIPNKTAGEYNDHSWNRQKDGSTKKGKNMTIRDCRQLGTVLTEINEQSREWTKEHPAIFPVALPFAYIEAMTNEADIIVDCFGGSGTTLIAAEKLNRQSFLMELSPSYCDIIVKRFIDFVDSDRDVFIERSGQKIGYANIVA